ncbi:MAG: ComEC/Rec2 family competence protein, partial [Planctomycetes bacterium]|nr:ComEC/Rec2 family competence protein [Planctomycetota bacterium]
MVGRLRGRLKTVLRKKYRQDIDPLVRALIFGQRAALDTDTHALLSEVGSLHFLAISGLHVGMLAAFLWAVFTAAGLPLSWRSGLLILLVWLYVVFTGFQVSARRAALMVSFVSAAPLFRREGDPVNAVLGAVFVILVWNPAELFGIGFQFTLVAVWAILYIFRQLRHIVWPWGDLIDRIQQPEERTILEDVKRYGGHYLFLSTSVWLVIAPLSAHHFNHFSLLTPLVNVMLWPVVLILIIDCFLLVPVALVFPPLAGPFVGAANLLCGQIRGILHLSSRLPGFVFHTPGPPTWWILGFFAILVLWVVRKRFVRGSTCFLAGATILAISFIIPDLTARDGENLCATLLDVGHGQSIVFRAPARSVMIYDAGSVSPGRVNSLERFLWRDRHRRVSLLAVSHRDCDHCSFVPRLGEHFRIEQLVIPPLPPGVPRSVLEEKLERACREKRSLWRGGEVRGHGLHFTALHPDERFLSMGNVSENDLSLVLLCRYAGWRMLLTGDIRTDAMDHLLREHSGELKADVLVLPHHGRWADGLVEFLEEVNPQVAVASCGDPLPGKTRQALAEAGVPVWTTYRAGALQFELTPWQLTLTSFRTERKIVLRREKLSKEYASSGAEICVQ